MAYNVYVNALLDLRRELESRIDSEVEDWMRERAEDGGYKQDEKIQSVAK